MTNKQKVFNYFLLILVAAIILPFIFSVVSNTLLIFTDFATFKLSIKKIYWSFYNNAHTYPLYYSAILGIFLLQWIQPANKAQAQFNQSVYIDTLYTGIMTVFYFAIAPQFFIYLKLNFYMSTPLSELSHVVNDIPAFWQLLLGYLAVDFLGWLHHLIRHKIPIFWAFHAVHHSQRQLNPFSNERVHIVDWFIANLIKFYPALFFTDSLGIILNYIAIHKILDHLNHANIKTNLGPLKYVFVTPQSHRVHHSGEREFFDKNFGVSLSIWDHLFGTQCKNYHAYPTTGIPDGSFPYEDKLGPYNLVGDFLKQQWYPFRKIHSLLKKETSNKPFTIDKE